MISAVVCADSNYAIGNKNGLLAHIPEDMKLFKDLTIGATVLMGRKTYDSLPQKPLPNRLNIVITSKVGERYERQEDGSVWMSMEYAKNWLINRRIVGDYVLIIGGGQIYKELLPFCEKVYLTKVFHEYETADTYFPNIEENREWMREKAGEVKEYNGLKYQFCEYVRVAPND